MSKALAGIIAACAAVIAVALCITAVLTFRANNAPTLTTQYYAVLLANGGAFFGRIENLNTEYPVLHDVYYIQSRTNPETKQVSNILVKRGQEWHSPDRMILNKRHLVLIEPVAEGSQVAKLIAEQGKVSATPPPPPAQK
jgi:hypothetical protein